MLVSCRKLKLGVATQAKRKIFFGLYFWSLLVVVPRGYSWLCTRYSKNYNGRSRTEPKSAAYEGGKHSPCSTIDSSHPPSTTLYIFFNLFLL